MSHPFPLEVEVTHRRSEAMRGARQERLAQMATPRDIAGDRRVGRETVSSVASQLSAGATGFVQVLRAFRAKVMHSRGAI